MTDIEEQEEEEQDDQEEYAEAFAEAAAATKPTVTESSTANGDVTRDGLALGEEGDVFGFGFGMEEE